METKASIYWHDESDDLFEVEADVTLHYVPPTPPWRGSRYTCPSDVDWHGEDGYIEGLDHVLEVVVYHDGVPRGEKLTGWELTCAAAEIERRLAEDTVEVEIHETEDDPDYLIDRMRDEALEARWER